MTTHSNNGAGRNVALPKENRPSWSPHDDPGRNRRSMGSDEWPRDRREDRAIGYVGDIDHDTTNFTNFARGPHRGKGPINYQRSDERIREDVCEALTEHEFVDASQIEVNVAGGEVNLTGRVPDRRTKRLAEDCAERVSGVHDVLNHLRIGDGEVKVAESHARTPKH